MNASSHINPDFAANGHDYKAEGPQPLLREIPPGAPYPVEALGPLRAAVEAAQGMTQAPFGLAAQSALAVASLAVQGFANVETLGGAAPLSLFCLTVAVSGERKSKTDGHLMAGATQYEESLQDQYAVDMVEWQNERELWEGKRRRLLKEATEGKDKMKATGAEADLRTLGPCPPAPLQPFLTVQEPTFEGVVKLLLSGRPSIGLFSDEGGSFVGGHAMNADNRAKTVAGLSKLWDGAALDRVRAGDGAVKVPGRRLAVHLMIQPVLALPLLADQIASGQGFLARFLITEPPSTIGTRLRRSDDEADKAILATFAAKLTGILKAPMPTADNNPQKLLPRHLPLSHRARELLWQFYAKAEAAQANGGEMEHVRAYASKSAEQAARIAGVLTLWADLDAPEVTLQAMAWGVTLAQFYLSEAQRLAEAGMVSEETAKAERLRKWLAESWPHGDVTPSEILNRGPNGLRERKALSGPLGLLVKTGHLVALPDGTVIRGAARREAYRIVGAGDAV